MHYHIFKNGGTTVDLFFEKVFGPRFLSFDVPEEGRWIGVRDLNRFLSENPHCAYLSCHKCGYPAPSYERRPILPFFFLRDPYSRVLSCFFFERDVQKKYPAETTLEDYVRFHLDSAMVTAILGLQMLTLTDSRLLPSWRRADLAGEPTAQAFRNLHATAVFGLVDRFDESMALIRNYMSRYFPEILDSDARSFDPSNVSPTPSDARRDAKSFLRENLMAATFARLDAALAPEVALLDLGERIFAERLVQYGPRAGTGSADGA